MIRWLDELKIWKDAPHNHPTRNFWWIALIALSICSSVGSLPVKAAGRVQKITICDRYGNSCGDEIKIVELQRMIMTIHTISDGLTIITPSIYLWKIFDPE